MGAISVGPAAVDLSSAEDELVLDQITLGGALSLRSRANLTVNPSKLSGGSSYSISSTGGELRIGSVTAGTFTAGDLSVSGGGVTLAGQTALRAGNVTARDAIDMQSAAGAVSAGNVQTSNGTLNVVGRDGVTITSVTATRGNVDLIAAQGAVRVGTTGSTFTVGTVTSGGAVRIDARDEILAGNITGSSWLKLSADSGAVTVGSLSAGSAHSSSDDCDGKAICINAGTGSIGGSNRSLTTGAVAAAAGDVVLRGRDGLSTGAVTVTTGGVALSSDGSLSAGAIEAGKSVDVRSSGGSVTVGAVSASATQSTSVTSDPCNGRVVCIQAGSATPSGAQTVTSGAITANNGSAFVAARGGLTTGAVSASAGEIVLSGGSGAVSASGALVTGTGATSDADHRIRVTGSSLGLQAVTASGNIELSAEGASGTVTSGVLTARRALTVSSTGSLALEAQKIGGTPESVGVSSSAGSVCLGRIVNGQCTGEDLSRAATVALNGRDGVTAGAIDVATTATISSAQGTVTLGNVTARAGDLKITGKNAVKAGDVTGSAAVELTSESATLEANAVNAGGALKASGSTGVKIASAKGAAVEATSSAGAINVAGGLTATIGEIRVLGQTAVQTGDVSSATFIDLQSRAGTLQSGNLTARSAQSATTTSSGTACDGVAVCVQTGTDSAATSPASYTVKVGNVAATQGKVRLDGRGGVDAGTVSTANGSVAFSSSDHRQ
jgi:hypothetical protein